MLNHDIILGALIGLARATDGNSPSESTHRTLLEGLLSLSGFPTKIALEQIHEEKFKLIPSCLHCASPCGRTSDYDMELFHAAAYGIRTRKALLLSAVYGLAPFVYRDFLAGQNVSESCMILYRMLFAFGEDWEESYLDSALQDLSEAALSIINHN